MKMTIAFVIFCFSSVSSFAQSQPDPPYKRFPTLPPLKLLLTDSTTIFTDKDLSKNKPLFLILFSPDCEHCQQQTEELIARIDEFKKIQIVMASFIKLDKVKPFYEKYQLDRFSNITVGYDMQFLLPTYYRISYTPFLAFYDKKGKLIDGFQGALPLDKVLANFKD